MIDFTEYIYNYHIVTIIDPCTGNETLADTGILFVHNVDDGELGSKWVAIRFTEPVLGKKIVLQTYHLGYIGI